jgi:hypothetical protein
LTYRGFQPVPKGQLAGDSALARTFSTASGATSPGYTVAIVPLLVFAVIFGLSMD